MDTTTGANNNNDKSCDTDIYCRCHHRQQWSQQELDNVKRYLQYRFYYESGVRPVRPPCKSLYIQKDWKCLSADERHRFIRSIRQLYSRGIVQSYSELHNRWWTAWHKTYEFNEFHRAFNLAIERELWKLDPTLSGLPYWNYANDFAEPWKSCVWRDLGWAGHYKDGYCVGTGSLFDNLTINYQPRCVKREWSSDNTVAPFSAGELEASWMQSNPSVYQGLIGLQGLHFFIHLSIAGWHGDKSLPFAPNDFSFMLTHNYVDQLFYRIQLQSTESLVPVQSYTDRRLPRIDPLTGHWKPSDIYQFITWMNRSSVEYFQMGFGDQCFIYDSMIEPINRQMQGQPPRVPEAVKRLVDSLPETMLRQYYPQFARGKLDFTTNGFDMLSDDCNSGGRPPMTSRCRPIPFFRRYNDTSNGRRTSTLYRQNARLDEYVLIQQYQHVYWQLTRDLNSIGYCSPAVNTYSIS